MNTNNFDELYQKALIAAEKGSKDPKAIAAKAGLFRINKEDKIYYISEGNGYSGKGFDYAARDAEAVSEISGKEYNLAAIRKGTARGYLEYMRAMEEGREAYSKTGRVATKTLTPQLVGLEGKRVEVVDRHGETRRFIVGKSTGWIPIHLEISRRGSHGGGGVMGTPFKSVRVLENVR